MERSLAYSSGITAEFEIPTLGSISAVSRVQSLILPGGMSEGSFSRTAAANRAYTYMWKLKTFCE